MEDDTLLPREVGCKLCFCLILCDQGVLSLRSVSLV